MNGMDDGDLNLNVVNEAYGIRSDLYLDVLQVEPNAGANQIQDAFFERRNELVRLLADIDHAGDDLGMEWPRQHAERKIDAVVCAVRILGEPDLRLRYDDVRGERMRRSPSSSRRSRPHSENSQFRGTWGNMGLSQQGLLNISGVFMNSSTLCTDFFTSCRSDAEENEPPSWYARNQTAKANSSLRKLAPPPSHSSSIQKRNEMLNRGRTRRDTSLQPESLLRELTSSSLDGDASTQISNESTTFFHNVDDFENDESFFTVDDDESSAGGKQLTSSNLPSKRGVLDLLHEEILGVIDDMALSLEQVLNAFTLQEADIKAVVERIDKAKNQMATLRISKKFSRSKEKKASVTTTMTNQESLKDQKLHPSISRQREI
jgi:hypothetical protein